MKNLLTLIFGALSIAFLATTIGTYVVLDNQVDAHIEDNKILSYQVEQLKNQQKALTADVESVRGEYAEYKGAIESYFTYLDKINADIDDLTETYTTFTSSKDHEKSLALVDTFGNQFTVLSADTDSYVSALESNRELYESLGIDVSAELTQMGKTVPQVEGSLNQMREHMNA